ncbi:hypothetical protein I4F81_012503 [Pyropia yezoensis]|uniref:Uncharacterized protein n=1 Tax=Pyropia yezoensis TaxID=2788 RepID=A0ACC3CIW3_PYRYE|nr:hypothetical protein I4F81_012503 [Neopyropia yezoensis]
MAAAAAAKQPPTPAEPPSSAVTAAVAAAAMAVGRAAPDGGQIALPRPPPPFPPKWMGPPGANGTHHAMVSVRRSFQRAPSVPRNATTTSRRVASTHTHPCVAVVRDSRNATVSSRRYGAGGRLPPRGRPPAGTPATLATKDAHEPVRGSDVAASRQMVSVRGGVTEGGGERLSRASASGRPQLESPSLSRRPSPSRGCSSWERPLVCSPPLVGREVPSWTPGCPSDAVPTSAAVAAAANAPPDGDPPQVSPGAPFGAAMPAAAAGTPPPASPSVAVAAADGRPPHPCSPPSVGGAARRTRHGRLVPSSLVRPSLRPSLLLLSLPPPSPSPSPPPLPPSPPLLLLSPLTWANGAGSPTATPSPPAAAGGRTHVHRHPGGGAA